MNLAYYISGHGYGHARRSAEVIRRLLQQDPGLTVHIRTSAPAFIFDPLPQHRITLESAALDPGAVEEDALRVSRDKTLAAVRAALGRAESLLSREVEFLKRANIRGIVADIPFLAGELARRTGLPVIGCANFTWDWIYEPWLHDTADGRELLATIGGCYARFTAMLRMPFGGISNVFPEVHDTPLVAWQSDLRPDDVFAQIPPRARVDGPRILVGMRGGCSPEILRHAVNALPDVTFLVTEGPTVAENVVPVNLGPRLVFGDVLSICEGVISKLGYGLVADCASMGVGIIWPVRQGFREDLVMAADAAPRVRLTQIEVDDYLAGDWTDAVRHLLSSPHKPLVPPDGGPWCAHFILDRLCQM